MNDIIPIMSIKAGIPAKSDNSGMENKWLDILKLMWNIEDTSKLFDFS